MLACKAIHHGVERRGLVYRVANLRSLQVLGTGVVALEDLIELLTGQIYKGVDDDRSLVEFRLELLRQVVVELTSRGTQLLSLPPAFDFGREGLEALPNFTLLRLRGCEAGDGFETLSTINDIFEASCRVSEQE